MPSLELIEQGEQRRDDIMAFIRKWRDEHGYSPTIRECADAVGLSLNSTKRHIDKLAEVGRLHKTPNRQRAIVPADEVDQ